MTARALSLLAAFASPVFMIAAIAGWLYGVWPATPLTLGVAAFAVVSGPLLGIWHVATAREWEDAGEEPPVVLAPVTPAAPPLLLTPKAARARAFVNWRATPNEAITQRDRARRANQYLRT